MSSPVIKSREMQRSAEVPVEEQNAAVVTHIMMHDGPEGIRTKHSFVKRDTEQKVFAALKSDFVL